MSQVAFAEVGWNILSVKDWLQKQRQLKAEREQDENCFQIFVSVFLVSFPAFWLFLNSCNFQNEVLGQ